ncbi:MAG: hypothetical protein NVS2B7_40960 [Herpetosiphon sp.]
MSTPNYGSTTFVPWSHRDRIGTRTRLLRAESCVKTAYIGGVWEERIGQTYGKERYSFASHIFATYDSANAYYWLHGDDVGSILHVGNGATYVS